MKESKIIDLFDGKIICAWQDEKYVFLHFPFYCVYIPKEYWNDILKELKQLKKVKP